MNRIIGIPLSDEDENGMVEMMFVPCGIIENPEIPAVPLHVNMPNPLLDVTDATTTVDPSFGNMCKEALIDSHLKQIIKEVIKEKINRDAIFISD